jgi:response regulator of citrate/malate metabolism
MRETTPDERHGIMRDLIKKHGKPIDFTALTELYKEYQRQSHLLRHDDPESQPHIEDIKKMADILADMTVENFIYDYPALNYLLTHKG